MIINVDFTPRWDKARVWFGEIPEAARMRGPFVHLLSDEVAGIDSRSRANTVAVEWFGARGGHDPYGLIGAALRPEPGKLKVVSIVEQPRRRFENALLADPEYPVLVGLEPEYAFAVARGIAGLNVGEKKISGLIEITAAAVSPVESSQNAFEHLGRFLGKLLLMENLPENEVLRKIFEDRMTLPR